MCGITAIYNENGIALKQKHMVNAMNQEMIYRGPDEQSVWSDDNVIFGHCRLSIIGVGNGSQPLFNRDKTISLICNGEIYNYVELKEELTKKGYIFYSSSDCEVIIYLYQEYGLDLFKYLRGMFAFCLWDSSQKQMITCRDRLGKKPLYYARSMDGIVFSSELKAISKHFLKTYTFDYSTIRYTLKYSHPISIVDTHISQIKKVKPGEYIVVKDDCMSHHIYWNSNKVKTINTDFVSAKNKILNLLTESVDIRLRSDMPVAVLLSSGIDSTAVAALAKKCRTEVHAITIGYKGSHSSDEREMAGKFAKEHGLIWHQVELDEKDYKTYFDEYTAVIDEPICDVAAIAQWGIYKKAKELGFKVLLSGIGGDELFYGYPTHNAYANSWEKALKIPKYFPVNSLKGTAAFFKYVIENKEQINLFYSDKSKNHLTKYYIKEFEKFDFKWPDVNGINNVDELAEIYSIKDTGIEKVYLYMYEIWLINNCFHQTDKLGLGNSVEVRAPFADHMLSEYLFSLPLELKYNPNNPKWLLKEAMKGVLPNYILNNKKKGFTPPSSFIGEIVDAYESTFFSMKLKNYNQVLVDKLLTDYNNKTLKFA